MSVYPRNSRKFSPVKSFRYTVCAEGHGLWWSLSYSSSLFIQSTTVGSTDMGWPSMDCTVMAHCVPWLEAPSFPGSAIAANKFMDNAFEGALSPNHCHQSALARAPLPMHWSREARQGRAFMLVACKKTICTSLCAHRKLQKGAWVGLT